MLSLMSCLEVLDVILFLLLRYMLPRIVESGVRARFDTLVDARLGHADRN